MENSCGIILVLINVITVSKLMLGLSAFKKIINFIFLMKKMHILIILFVIGVLYLLVMPSNAPLEEEVSGDVLEESMSSGVSVNPIEHATLVLGIDGRTVYVDPVGGAVAFGGQAPADIVLITDVHGDHLSIDTLAEVASAETQIVAPQAVYDELPEDLQARTLVLANGESTTFESLSIEALPMYNLPESEDAYHVKGRGNGYVLRAGEDTVYIAGDTGPTEEMKSLTDIDIAFVPMNLPYTMTVDDAAEAVIAFKPAQVYPYHYRGMDGFGDVDRFKELVDAAGLSIEVVLADWYPTEE